MPKPDFALRYRPLKDAEECIKQLRSVVLFHPDELSMKIETKYCVCAQGEVKIGQKSNRMFQCLHCREWYHEDCLDIPDDSDFENAEFKCEWCSDKEDKLGMQRWRTGRKKPKLRHLNDRPIVAGVEEGADKSPMFAEPIKWDDKVDEIKELSRSEKPSKKGSWRKAHSN